MEKEHGQTHSGGPSGQRLSSTLLGPFQQTDSDQDKRLAVAQSKSSISGGAPKVLLGTESILSNQVVTFLGIKAVHSLCHQFHLRLNPIPNGSFSVVGEWECIDAMNDKILKLLAKERTSAAFSLVFPDTMSSPNIYGSQEASSTKMDVDQAGAATLNTFQINKITFDLASLVASLQLENIKAECKVEFKSDLLQNEAVLVTVVGTGAGSDVARGFSSLQILYSEVSNNMGETHIEVGANDDVSSLKSYPWAEKGIMLLHNESGRKFTLIGLKTMLQPAEQEAHSLLKIGQSKDKTTLGKGKSGTRTSSGDSTGLGADGNCPICMQRMTKPRKLPCGHHFCKSCIGQWEKQRPVCPVCNKPFGVITGNQPTNATMHVVTSPNPLPGLPANTGTITITYDVPHGIQGSEHPNPGKPYAGTRRTAYLPNTQQGRELFDLLRKAFKARLIFTVGRSITSGCDNAVTWNDIHHKTSRSPGPYGYPDPTYLERLRKDLKAKGIE
jgi:deltex-like protein